MYVGVSGQVCLIIEKMEYTLVLLGLVLYLTASLFFLILSRKWISNNIVCNRLQGKVKSCTKAKTACPKITQCVEGSYPPQ